METSPSDVGAVAQWSTCPGYADYGHMIILTTAAGPRQIIVEFYKDTSELLFYDTEGVEYDSGLYLEEHEQDPLAAAKHFIKDHQEDRAGFEEEIEPVTVTSSEFWDELQAKSSEHRNRKITVHTYGNKFKKYKRYTETQKNFNALVINTERPRHLDLRHIRGTDPELQKVVASGKRFKEVMSRIVNTIEEENLNFIGIYCRAGHHRSVACGELLKSYIYPNARLSHLTLNK